MENYSGFLEHTDVYIGRLVDSIEKAGEMDDTLILYIVGDNGASGEGGLEGTVNEIASLNGIQLGLAGLEAKFAEIGGPATEPHVPAAWAWAVNTPFQWTKQVASHFGGTRNGLVVHWPKGIAAKGELRSQFHHVIDVAPTVLTAAHVTEPEVVNGVKQKPMEGVSMSTLSTMAAPSLAERRSTSRCSAIAASTRTAGWPRRSMVAYRGRLRAEAPAPSTATRGSYNVNEDFSQVENLAAQYPDKVKALQAAFIVEAKKYNVLPLDDRMSERFNATLRPNPLAGLKKFSYGPGVTGISESAVLNTHNVPFTVTADVEVGDSGSDGVFSAIGGISSGWSFYVKEGKPTFYYNYFEVEHARIQSSGRCRRVGRASVWISHRWSLALASRRT